MLHPGYHSDGIVPESHRLPFSSGNCPNLFSAAKRPTLWTFYYYRITYSSCQQNNDRIKYIFYLKCQNPESRRQRYEKSELLPWSFGIFAMNSIWRRLLSFTIWTLRCGFVTDSFCYVRAVSTPAALMRFKRFLDAASERAIYCSICAANRHFRSIIGKPESLSALSWKQSRATWRGKKRSTIIIAAQMMKCLMLRKQKSGYRSRLEFLIPMSVIAVVRQLVQTGFGCPETKNCAWTAMRRMTDLTFERFSVDHKYDPLQLRQAIKQ